MRIKDYRRLSLYGTVAFLILAAAGGAAIALGHTNAGVALLIIGIAGMVIASAGIRLYGKMTADAFFRRKE